jgi:hypothetical protein
MRFLGVCLVLCGCVDWSRRDTAREVAFFAVTTIDWHQTQSIAAGCMELNPILGPCGDRVSVGIYFPFMLIAHVTAAAALPRDWRPSFQAFTIGMESATVVINTQTD